MRFSTRTLPLFALLALLGLLAPRALAQAVCIPQASGVPALGGHPNWYEPMDPACQAALAACEPNDLACEADVTDCDPEYWSELDDPRWRGSYLAAFGGMSASEHVTFRALRHGAGADEALYLSWHVRADPSLDNQVDGLWVGFSQDGGPDLVFFVTPFNFSDSDLTNKLPHAALAFQRDVVGNLVGQPSPPEWLLDDTSPFSDTRIWVDTLDAGPDGEWAVQMRVPVSAAGFDAGVDLADSFKMWFEVQVKVPDDPLCMADGCIVLYSYPDGLHAADVLAQTDSTNWADFRKDLPPTDAACIQGVSLTASDVGVASAADCANPAFNLSSTIDLLTDLGGPQTNTFCARPLNETGGPVGAGDVRATFRIANWGTQPDWNDVDDPIDNLWTPINPASPATGAAFNDGDKGALTHDLMLTLANPPASDFDVCHFEFAIAADRPALCAGFTPTRRRHQCMLVELDGAPGLQLSTSSVYRNMNFVDASVFRRVAEVSVVGLAAKPVPEPQRAVFLYVKTHNMPASVGGGGGTGNGGGGGDRPTGERPTGERPNDERPNDGVVLFRTDGGENRASAPPHDGDGDGEPDPRPVPPLEKTPYEKLRDSMPTYVVHAYHDTGRTTTFDGRTYGVLRPQTSFGYFVRHEGDLEGWRHELTGAEEIVPNFYKIDVPEGGTRDVVTTIEALEGSRRSFSLHAGFNDPQSPLSSFADGGKSFGLDLELMLTHDLAFEIFLGYDEFDGKGNSPDVEVLHLAADLRWYLGAGPVRPFVLGGVGAYDVDPGSTEPGVLAGLGLQFPVTPVIDVEAEARYHLVNASPDLEWLAFHAGLRIGF